jgi:hypothetical protein
VIPRSRGHEGRESTQSPTLAVALGMGLHAPERTLSGAAYPQRLAELLAISQQAFRLQRRHTGFHHYGSSIRTVLNVTKTV